MNLTEFIRKNDIKTVDGLEFNNSPEFFRMREFERTCHVIQGVSFLDNETYEVKELDVMLKGSVQEKWDRNEKRQRGSSSSIGCSGIPVVPMGLTRLKTLCPRVRRSTRQ